MMDNFSKFVEAVPLRHKEAITVATALVETVIVRYGAPFQILTDRGRNVEGNVFQEICRLLEIDKVKTSSYHPRGNGLIERFHRTLNSMLGKVVSAHQHDWDDFLPYVLSAYRSSPHEVTGFTPNLLVFGRETRAPLDLVFGCPGDADVERSTYSVFVDGMTEKFESAYREVRQALKKAAERRKHQYDLRVRPAKFTEGQWVYYLNPRRYRGRSPKWQRCYTGPYRIQKSLGAVNFLLQKSPKAKGFIAHIDKLRPCRGRTTSQWNELEGQPQVVERMPLSTELNDDSEDEDVMVRPRREIRRPVRLVEM